MSKGGKKVLSSFIVWLHAIRKKKKKKEGEGGVISQVSKILGERNS